MSAAFLQRDGADSPVVQWDQRGGVLVVTLDDAGSRNAIGPDVNSTITRVLAAAGGDPEVRAVVLTGANGYFSAGGNMRALRRTVEMSPAERVEVTDRLAAMIRTVRELDKPVIAAVEGGAAGIGFALALACDMVVAAREARFAAAQVRLGLTPDGGITRFLLDAMPRQLASEICMLGQPIAADRLHAFGLVTRLVDGGAALATALDLAETLSAGPMRTVGRIKRLLADASPASLDACLALEGETINAARADPEAAEGIAAFLEKRRPAF